MEHTDSRREQVKEKGEEEGEEYTSSSEFDDANISRTFL
jgi:hypothetical protein